MYVHIILLQRDVTYEEAKQFADENGKRIIDTVCRITDLYPIGLLFMEASAKT